MCTLLAGVAAWRPDREAPAAVQGPVRRRLWKRRATVGRQRQDRRRPRRQCAGERFRHPVRIRLDARGGASAFGQASAGFSYTLTHTRASFSRVGERWRPRTTRRSRSPTVGDLCGGTSSGDVQLWSGARLSTSHDSVTYLAAVPLCPTLPGLIDPQSGLAVVDPSAWRSTRVTTVTRVERRRPEPEAISTPRHVVGRLQPADEVVRRRACGISSSQIRVNGQTDRPAWQGAGPASRLPETQARYSAGRCHSVLHSADVGLGLGHGLARHAQHDVVV